MLLNSCMEDENNWDQFEPEIQNIHKAIKIITKYTPQLDKKTNTTTWRESTK